ncbi:HAMP domain-containing histidine kinase [Helicobacter sp. MIT 11-5569]|uniref:sensor histidine kinase n=1 Tax=Helicobacter sp. MIT 11-5569 TaxID=1548151 RepID=UPI000A446E8B|nr:HAMP domain-containing sensor histidine kinase [Helicobacter sp. MIT 11-5569]TLD84529.1 HAMP domain-containing histidine kinase [Helicobacter sp. MIT 11-5569]
MHIFHIFGTTLADKARILVFNIASGLLSLAFVSFVYHFSLKYDYDLLFMEHSQSLVNLEKVRDAINVSQTLLHTAQNSAEILGARDNIVTQWNLYEKSQSRLLDSSDSGNLLFNAYYFFVEDGVIEHKKLELEKHLKDLESAIYAYLEIFQPKTLEYSSDKIQQSVSELNRKISLILHLNLQFTEIKKERNSTLHNMLQKAILVIMCLIMLVTILLSFLILRNIKNLHATLEQKVNEKTRELQNLNDSLQMMIDNEVLENRKKDQIMYQQARLASMGEMIGNIAHQWRQPLNALMLLIQTFKVKSQNGKLTQEFIELQVEDGLKIAKRMSQTIEDFRNFFNSSSDKEFFNLKENLQDSISLVDAFLKQNEITITIDCADDIMLFGYKNAFSQAILNLIKNSEDVLKEREVMPARIRIAVEIAQESESKNESTKDCVKILFMDNGGGIKLDDIQKIFEPYFTTKHKSVGTGIGLYMSKQIIEKQMQGSIEVRNVRYDDVFNIVCKGEECAQDCKQKDGTCGAQFIITIPLSAKKEKQ